MTTLTAQRPTSPGHQPAVARRQPTRSRCCTATCCTWCATRVCRSSSSSGRWCSCCCSCSSSAARSGAGLPGVDPAGGREAYLAYVMPGILAMTIAGTAGGIATTVAMDMTEGITARFRTMAISRAAVLAGHVLGNTIQAIIAVVARARRRPADRLPPDRGTGRVGGRCRPDRAHLLRDQLARGRHGHAGEVGRDGKQPAPAAARSCPSSAAASCRPSRCRRGMQWFARVPAVHAVHRDHPRAAARYAARLGPGRSPSGGAS